MSRWSRFTQGATNIDFVPWWRRFLVVSAVLVVASVLSLFVRGLNLGIDFVGGVSWEVPAPGVSVSEAREALGEVDQENAKIQIVGDSTLRVQGPEMSEEELQEVRQVLADVAGSDVAEVGVSTVGASWGQDITESAVRALVLFFAAILVYLTIRLEWRMAVAAVVAVVHDVVISVGVYSVLRFEVTPGTVIAFLTILGYSIYDTIVVDDKIKENEHLVGASGRMTYTQMVNRSMNQVLMRSLNTSITSLLPVLALLVVGAGMMGAVTLQEFALALFVGMAVGIYSSIFVASPVLVWMKEREPGNRAVRDRLGVTGGTFSDRGLAGDGDRATERAAGTSSGAGDPYRASGATSVRSGTSAPSATADTATRPAPPRVPSGTIPPRPRKKTRRR